MDDVIILSKDAEVTFLEDGRVEVRDPALALRADVGVAKRAVEAMTALVAASAEPSTQAPAE